MFYIEFASRRSLAGGVDREDVPWTRYPRPFATHNEALQESWWLGDWDPDFEYRVTEKDDAC